MKELTPKEQESVLWTGKSGKGIQEENHRDT